MTESNTQLAKRWFEEVWNQRRDETVREMLHPEIVGQMEGLEVRSQKDYLDARAGLLGAIPDLAVNVEAVVSEGNETVVRWSATGTHTGSGLGLEPSRRKASFRGITWLVFSDGRIVQGWDSWNQGLLLQQLTAPGLSSDDGRLKHL